MKIENPFLTSGYISSEYFCNRTSEIKYIINNASSSLNMALFSIRRMGKTGLIHHCINMLRKKDIKCIYFDIMFTKSISDFAAEFAKNYFNQAATVSQKALKLFSNMLKSFAISLTADPMTGALGFELKQTRDDTIYDDLDTLFEQIKKAKDKYFIAIDEFQQILTYPEKNFEAYLRSKIQFINNASFVFSGSKKHLLLSIFGQYSKPFWQTVSFMELKPIPMNEYNDFIINWLDKKNINLANGVFDLIYRRCRGITYFIQLVLHYLFDAAADIITEKKALDIITYIIKERESYYINMLELLTSKQKKLLNALAKEEGKDKPLSAEFLEKYELGASSTVKSALTNLIDKEIIYKESDKFYVADPMFSEWLKNL